MKILFFLILFVGLAYSGEGQILESRVARFAKENRIDSFLIYNRFLDGSFPLDSCHWEEPHYLFWHQNGQWFLKRFDFCQTFKTVQLDSLNPLKFYILHKSKIVKEEILPPTYYETVLRKGKKEVLTVTSQAGHQPFQIFQYYAGGRQKSTMAGEYDLSFKRFDNGRKNINYAVNSKTKLNALIDITSKLIIRLEEEKKLVAE